MTVFESVLLSAVLRLPDDMPLADKAARVMRVLKDLRLTHVADSYVGNKSKRYADQPDTERQRLRDRKRPASTPCRACTPAFILS